jgi:hypothetical protein
LLSSDDQIKQVINKQVLRYLPYEQPIELDTFVNNTIKKLISRSNRCYTSSLLVESKKSIKNNRKQKKITVHDLKIESTFFIKISLSSVFFIPSTSLEYELAMYFSCCLIVPE